MLLSIKRNNEYYLSFYISLEIENTQNMSSIGKHPDDTIFKVNIK